MSEHHEPWVVECDEEGVFVADCDGDEITTLDKEKARRIVACVNAMRDVTTETLEAIAQDDAARNYLSEFMENYEL